MKSNEERAMIKALNTIEVVTLFVDDLEATKSFYLRVFAARVVFEDSESAVFKFQNLMINLLKVSSAHGLVEPLGPGGRESGPRFMPTFLVSNVDAVCEELAQHGVGLLNGPIDRPWGRRTAAFADPAGNVWEIAQELNATPVDAR
jgi:catechol 2,3-dioxygenase-like lactoylglutathione lyase family enzyme